MYRRSEAYASVRNLAARHLSASDRSGNKAFDTVYHSTSLDLRKRQHYGISDNALNWFSDYFSNRYHYLSIDNVNSSNKQKLPALRHPGRPDLPAN